MCQFGDVIGCEEWDAILNESLVAMFHLRDLPNNATDCAREHQYTH